MSSVFQDQQGEEGAVRPDTSFLISKSSDSESEICVEITEQSLQHGSRFRYNIDRRGLARPHLDLEILMLLIKENKIYVEITEQPCKYGYRFRYKNEVNRAGKIKGVKSTHNHITYPTITVEGFNGSVLVLISLVTNDTPHNPHPHQLVGEGCKMGFYSRRFDNSEMLISFGNLGIQCVKRKQVDESLELRKNCPFKLYRTQFSDASYLRKMDFFVVRLCFQVFLETIHGYIPLPPKISEPIYDKKHTSDLFIVNLLPRSAKVEGGEEIILLCRHINHDDIQIIFEETNDDGEIIWFTAVPFSSQDVHQNAAISFKSPEYINKNIGRDVKCSVYLRRKLDGSVGNRWAFTLLHTIGTVADVPFDPASSVPDSGEVDTPTNHQQTDLPNHGYFENTHSPKAASIRDYLENEKLIGNEGIDSLSYPSLDSKAINDGYNFLNDFFNGKTEFQLAETVLSEDLCGLSSDSNDDMFYQPCSIYENTNSYENTANFESGDHQYNRIHLLSSLSLDDSCSQDVSETPSDTGDYSDSCIDALRNLCLKDLNLQNLDEASSEAEHRPDNCINELSSLRSDESNSHNFRETSCDVEDRPDNCSNALSNLRLDDSNSQNLGETSSDAEDLTDNCITALSNLILDATNSVNLHKTSSDAEDRPGNCINALNNLKLDDSDSQNLSKTMSKLTKSSL